MGFPAVLADDLAYSVAADHLARQDADLPAGHLAEHRDCGRQQLRTLGQVRLCVLNS